MERTHARRRAPAQELLHERDRVREAGAVRERREALGADERVDLGLRAPLHGRVERHGEEEGVVGGDDLHARMRQYVVAVETCGVGRTVSEPPKQQTKSSAWAVWIEKTARLASVDRDSRGLDKLVVPGIAVGILQMLRHKRRARGARPLLARDN